MKLKIYLVVFLLCFLSSLLPACGVGLGAAQRHPTYTIRQNTFVYLADNYTISGDGVVTIAGDYWIPEGLSWAKRTGNLTVTPPYIIEESNKQ